MFLILGNLVFSQVGIATTTPHASSDLELGATNKALYLNRVADPATINDPQPGMVLYDTTEHCVKVYGGDPAAWSDCIGNPAGSGVSAIDCSAALSPAATAGTASYSGSFTVSYTGGNGGAYTAQSITSTPAGFTATLAAGNFANGAGSVTYNVTAATVPAAGNYTFNITLGGQTCTKTITVTQNPTGILTPNITLSQNRRHWIASVFDTDYLPYTAPASAASIAVVNADGTPDAVTVDYQGSITTTGITVQIPVASVTGSGNILAWTSTFVVPSMYAEDGQSRTLELSWAAQSYTATSKFITATIKSLGGTFNAKKLDINAGIGNDYLGLLLGAFQYPYNNAGTLTSYEVRDIPGIPDRMFGIADNTGNANSHLMLYLPVQAEDGNIWLNNNLGADYANLNKSNFNLAQQATGANDALAFGSLFQWGRKPDGHELITYTSSTGPGTPVHGTTETRSDNPNHALFIADTQYSYPNWWDSNIPYPTFWQQQGTANVNNPCPSGFRVPTTAEYTTWISAAGITNSTTAASSALKLTTGWPNYGGIRGYNTGYIAGSNTYWTSTYSATGFYDGVLPDAMLMNPSSAPLIRNNSYAPANGLSIRCIQQ